MSFPFDPFNHLIKIDIFVVDRDLGMVNRDPEPLRQGIGIVLP